MFPIVPKSPALVEGWMDEEAATLVLRGTTPTGERRVSYQLESYHVEAGPKAWRIKKEWFPDLR